MEKPKNINLPYNAFGINSGWKKLARHQLTAVLGAAAGFLGASGADAQVTFVEATSANTIGSAYSTTSNLYTDNLWSIRAIGTGNADAVGNTIFEAGPHGGSENVPVIATTITGLTPGAAYEAYLFFVTQPTSNPGELWRVRAGFDAGSLTAYDRDSAATTVLPDGSTTALADPSGNPVTVPTNRDYRQATLGNAVADSSGNLTIYVDAGIGTADQNHRTWYDGVGYRPVGGSSTLPITVDPATPLTTGAGNFATEWNTAGNFESWTLSNATASVSGGAISGTATTTDSSVRLNNFAGGPDLDLGWNDFLEVRMQVPAAYAGPIQIYYGTTSYTIATAGGGTTTAATTGFSANRVITIPASSIPDDGAFHTYRVDLGLEPSWRATLRDLRIDPVDGIGSSGMAFAIDYIRIGDEPGAAAYQPRYTTECPAAGGSFTVPGGPTHTVLSMESKHFRFLWSTIVDDSPGWTADMAHGTLRNAEEAWQVFAKKLGYREVCWPIGTTSGTRYKLNITTWHPGYWAGPDDFGGTALSRMNITPDGLRVDPATWVIPHELMHCFQFHNTTGNVPGEWFEFHANYGRERWIQHFQAFYPNSSGIDPTHLRSAHLNIGEGREYYLCWPFFQYIDENPDDLPDLGEGKTVALWQQTQAGEYPFMALERLTTTSSIKDIAGYFARRGATYNFSNKTAVNATLATFGEPLDNAATARWQFTDLVQRPDDTTWWRVPYEMAPAQGSYAIHELVPTGSGGGRVVTVNLHGLADSARGADWRASFIVIADDGSERYSSLWGSGNNSVTLAANENKVYLSVAGAPATFYYGGADEAVYPYRSHPSKARFPYEIQVTGATPKQRDNGSTSGLVQHSNGGGWKAGTATVAASAYLGPNARVLGTANVSGSARIEDYAMVSGSAQVSGSAIVSGHAWVRGNAIVNTNAKVRDWALVEGGTVTGSARILEHGNFKGGTAQDLATVKGSAGTLLGTLSGNAILDGDYGDFFSGRDVANGVAFGHLPYAGVPDSYIKALPAGLYASYDFASAHDSRIRDQYGVTDGFTVGSPTWISKDAKRKGYLTFDGSTQSVLLDRSVADLRDFTFTAWIKPNGGVGDQAVLWLGATSTKRLYFTPNDGSGLAKFSIVNGGAEQNLTAAALTPGVWTHVAVILDTATATGKLYYNGVQAASGSITIRPDQLLAANTATALQHNYLARAQGSLKPMFNGALDHVQFYGTALSAAAVAALQPPTAPAGAGTLHVDLRASDASAGAATWVNNGTIGNFTRVNSPAKVTNVVSTGVPGVQFNGSSQAYTGPNTVADLEAGDDRSIEVWVYNPGITDEESMVSWAYRGTEARAMSFNFGSSSTYNAVTHWGGSYDVSWSPTPSAGAWHHLAYTYDGATIAKVYVDGMLSTSKTLPGALTTFAGEPIHLGRQQDNQNGTSFSKYFSGYLNTVRIHGGVLTDAQIAANYELGPVGAPGNTAPVATPQSNSLSEDGSVAITLAGTDANGDSLTYAVSAAPAHGTLSGTGPNLIYTPDANYAGPDSFSFTASDGSLTSAPAEVSFTIVSTNQPPSIPPISDQTTDFGTAITIPFTVDDVDNSPAALTPSGSAANASLIPSGSFVFGGSGADRNVTITPASGQSGSTLVTLGVSDGVATGERSFTLKVRSSLETWRKLHFGTDAPTGSADDEADPDGDGRPNIEEYVAGTNPTDSADFFRLTPVPGMTGHFSAAGKAGRIYIFQRSAVPAGGEWEGLNSEGPLAADQPLEFADPAPPAASAFYRLQVNLLPLPLRLQQP